MFLNYPQQNYKNQKTSISQFLFDNSAYDCMPKNSYIAAVDKSLPLYDAIKLLIQESHQELLMWDNQMIQWNWVFSLADAIRFTLYAVRSVLQYKTITFQHNSFRKLSEDRIEMCNGFRFDVNNNDSKKQQSDMMIEQQMENEFDINNYTINQSLRSKFLNQTMKVTLNQFMNQVYDLKSFQLKTVSLQTKLSFIIFKMLSQKIHRIIVYQKPSKMFTSILNYKDILLFLLRSVNQQFTNTSQYNIPIGSLLQQGRKSRQNIVNIKQTVWTVFDIMINKNKAVWLNVVDDNNCYITTIFREDFVIILNGWRINLLSLSLKQYLQIKQKQKKNENIPDFQMFKTNQTIKQIVQKIVMCKRNTLVSIDQNKKINYTLGLSQLFRLYIQ